jgi:hypothetical protein
VPRPEVGYRGEKLATVPDGGHPESGEIVRRKLRQDGGVDVAFAEGVLVLLETQTF